MLKPLQAVRTRSLLFLYKIHKQYRSEFLNPRELNFDDKRDPCPSFAPNGVKSKFPTVFWSRGVVAIFA